MGTDQLAPLLRRDPRVTVWEQTNLRDLTLDHVDHRPVDLVVADVSFISLTLLIEPLTAVTAADGRLLLLVKPQFEVGRERLGKGGVVRSAELQREAVTRGRRGRRGSRLAGRRRSRRAGCPAAPATRSSSCCSTG